MKPNWMIELLRAADGGGAAPAAGDPPPADTQPDVGSVLFPTEKPADTPPADAPAAGDWKEYSPDPAKSEVENAAAKAEHDKTKPADPAADKVPDDGKYDLKMPEGVELDADLAEALMPEFKGLGLTNAQAQKLVDAYTKLQQGRAEKQMEGFGKVVSGWAETAKKDPEIGGDKWAGSVQAAQRAVNTLGTPALKEYLEASGGGNHPEIIRFMAKAGSMIQEDNPASGGSGGRGQPVDPAHLIFANDAPKG